MAPELRSARKKLSYPLYGASFDPLNADFLLVGGGGGSAATGVPNKISLLDVSRTAELSEIADIELSKTEDSVTSLAVADSSETSLTAYAGINSSSADQEKGKNEHFRSFRVPLPSRKRRADGGSVATAPDARSSQTEALARTTFFRSRPGSKNETYQRVLRVSPGSKDDRKRIAAIATGLATQSEIVTFEAIPSPAQGDVVSRINLEAGEANDLDIIDLDGSRDHILAYCTDQNVYVQVIPQQNSKETKEPVDIHSWSLQGGKIRGLRWLNPRYILLLRNQPGEKGADVALIKTDVDYTQSQIVLVTRLRRSTKRATGLDTCALSESTGGEQQFAIAVTSREKSSVEIFVVDYNSSSGMKKFVPYEYIPEVHNGPITGVAFSKFTRPQPPTTKDTKPQYLKLATVGMDQTVVVHTLPLRPYPASSKSPRYCLIAPSSLLNDMKGYLMALLVVALTAFFMQAFCEIRGVVPPRLGATAWLSPAWQQRIAWPYYWSNNGGGPGPVIPESMPPIVQTATSSLSAATEAMTEAAADTFQAAAERAQVIAAEAEPGAILSYLASHPDTTEQRIVVRENTDEQNPEGKLSAELHHHESEHLLDETLKRFDELSEVQKEKWLKKLSNAGHWTESQGVSVLKGILFSELAGVVGAALG